MSSRLSVLLIGSLLIVFGIGFALGSSFRDGSSEQLDPTPSRPSNPRPDAGHAALMEAERRGRRLQGQIETLELALHAARGTQPPEPRPVAPETTGAGEFPDNLPEQFTSAGFEQIVRDVVRDCDLGVDLADIDCSEYPCLAWVRSKNLARSHVSPSGCGRWNQAFRGGSLVTYALEGNPFGGRTERYHVWVVTPPSRDRDANQRLINRGEKRMNARWADMIGDSGP